MKTILFAVAAFMLLAPLARGQTLAPSVIASGGGTGKGNKITLEWTIGESAVATIPTRNGLLTEGFHQPMLQVRPEQKPDPDSAYLVAIAPNPVTSELTVRISSQKEEDIRIELLDLPGQRITLARGQLPEYQQRLDLSALPAGVYLLRIRKANGELIETHKVTKIQ